MFQLNTTQPNNSSNNKITLKLLLNQAVHLKKKKKYTMEA
jgi:hypothetical protein